MKASCFKNFPVVRLLGHLDNMMQSLHFCCVEVISKNEKTNLNSYV